MKTSKHNGEDNRDASNLDAMQRILILSELIHRFDVLSIKKMLPDDVEYGYDYQRSEMLTFISTVREKSGLSDEIIKEMCMDAARYMYNSQSLLDKTHRWKMRMLFGIIIVEILSLGFHESEGA